MSAGGAKGVAKKRAGGPRLFDNEFSDDNIGRLLTGEGLVPRRFQGTAGFLDVVSWNIRWFDHQDPERVTAITNVLSELNADVIVLCEIADDGALDQVVANLVQQQAGMYSLFMGKSGGQQRVAFLWDRDWVRAKEDILELFEDENLTVTAEVGSGRSKVFPRLPLWGYFEATGEKDDESFTFELVGLHLKAQGPAPQGYNGPAKRWGVPQRTQAARRLAQWIDAPDDHWDEDVILVGDWNAKPDEKEWKVLREMEQNGELDFAEINPNGEITHMARLNKSGPAGTRIDLHVLTDDAATHAVPNNKGLVIKWSLFDHLDALDSAERADLFKQLKQRFSDHLPVLSRFYFAQP